MRILTVGDPHIQSKHLDDAKLFTDRLRDVALREKPDIIVLLGDILHTHEKLHTQALNHARSLFMKMAEIAPTYVLVGNHDYINNSQRLSDNHWMVSMRELPNVTIVDRVIEVLHGAEHRFIMLPYVPDGQFHEVLDESQLEWRTSTAVFGHQLFDGAKMGAIVAKGVEEWNGPPLCISGHIHDKQRFDHLHYVGASFAHAFGDTAEKTIAIYNFQQSGMEYVDVSLDMPRLITLRGVVGDSDTLIAKILKRNNSDNNRYRLVLTGEPSEVVTLKKSALYKQLQSSTVKLVIRTAAREVENDTKEVGVVKRFNEVLYTLLHSDTEKLIAKAALEGSLDDGDGFQECDRVIRPRIRIVD